MTEVHSEQVLGDSVAAIAAALRPPSVFGAPGLRARLREAATHLTCMLRDAAMVDATMHVVDPDTPMIGGAIGLLGSSRRPLSLLLMFLSPTLLLVFLSPGLRSFVLFGPRVYRSHGSGEKKYGRCFGHRFHRHVLPLFV